MRDWSDPGRVSPPVPPHLRVARPSRDLDAATRFYTQALDLDAPAVPNANPYWNERGITVQDPDGYRIVIENAAWPGPAEPS
jgi:hypothetical protein